MQKSNFDFLEKIIKGRRTTKAMAMNGKQILDNEIEKLIDLADWAPTHGNTEPWQFFIYKGESLQNFGKIHAELYWEHTSEEKRFSEKKDKLQFGISKASHLMIAVMKRGTNPKIPKIEEIAAASSAIQNILLGATALGIATIWNSGGMTHHHSLKKHLQLAEEDVIMGLIYLGYTDEIKEGKRNIPLHHKTIWVR